MSNQQKTPPTSSSSLFDRANYIVFAPLGGGILYATATINQGRYGEAIQIMITAAAISFIVAVAFRLGYWLLNR